MGSFAIDLSDPDQTGGGHWLRRRLVVCLSCLRRVMVLPLVSAPCPRCGGAATPAEIPRRDE